MKVLFIGGTGLISSACTRLAVERGVELFLLNRGSDPDRARGATSLVADLRDEAAAERALAGHRFDVVVDWIAFTPDDIERDLRLFRDRADQFVFISSASAYLKPLGHWLLREDSPLANPFWDYSRTRSPARSACCAHTARTGSRSRSSARRSPTATRRSHWP